MVLAQDERASSAGLFDHQKVGLFCSVLAGLKGLGLMFGPIVLVQSIGMTQDR